MKQPYNNQYLLKLTCSALLALPLLISACAVGQGRHRAASLPNNTERKQVAGELIVNAVKGAEMLGVEMFADGMDRPFYSRAVTTESNTAKMDFPLRRLPQHVRVIWRKNDDVRLTNGKIVYGGPLAGDYTIPVASRIPASVFEEIERHGGALRIKFRLKPDGVMLGWDIQRKGFRPCTIFEYYNAGGDFREAELCNGSIARKGWFIDKSGRKIETDY